MIARVETLSRTIFSIHKKPLRLSAARCMPCLLLNMMTLGDQSRACKALGIEWGGYIYMHIYYYWLLSFLKMVTEEKM